MNWDNIEDNWKHIKSNVTEQWGNLNDGQLASRVLDTYESLDDMTELELSDWQLRLSDINRAK